jgi:hypothetical protein
VKFMLVDVVVVVCIMVHRHSSLLGLSILFSFPLSS